MIILPRLLKIVAIILSKEESNLIYGTEKKKFKERELKCDISVKKFL